MGLTSVTVFAGSVWPALLHPTDKDVFVPIHLDMINMIGFYPHVVHNRCRAVEPTSTETSKLTRRAILYAGAYLERRCRSLKDRVD